MLFWFSSYMAGMLSRGMSSMNSWLPHRMYPRFQGQTEKEVGTQLSRSGGNAFRVFDLHAISSTIVPTGQMDTRPGNSFHNRAAAAKPVQ